MGIAITWVILSKYLWDILLKYLWKIIRDHMIKHLGQQNPSTNKCSIKTPNYENIDVLKNQTFELKVLLLEQHFNFVRFYPKFNILLFNNTSTPIEYLKLCNIDCKARRTLLNMFPSLDYPCAKFLIDCLTKQHVWDIDVHDNYTENVKKPIHFILGCYGNENIVMYALDICDRENIDLECVDVFGWTPIHMVCYYGTEKTRSRMLDICVRKNLNMYCKTEMLWEPIHFILRKGWILVTKQGGLTVGDGLTILDLLSQNNRY